MRRTAQWLLARRNNPGGQAFLPADSWGRRDACIAWALSESGQPEIQSEVKQAIALGTKSDDPYVVALAAATAMNARDKLTGHRLLRKLAAAQTDDGYVDRRGSAIRREGLLSLRMETTALAALAWLKSPVFAPQTEKAVQWILAHRQADGTFGSAQATMLALMALCQQANTGRGSPNAGKLVVECEGLTIGRYSFTAGVREAIVIDGLEAALKPGDNRLGINLTGDNKMPYLLTVAYHSPEPDQSDACPVRLTVKLASPKVRRGQTVALRVELSDGIAYPAGTHPPMPAAIIGLPAGLEAQPEQLEALKNAGTIDYYEVRPRELVFYWRSTAGVQRVYLDLKAALPGKYVGPASCAYFCDAPEYKHWSDPLSIEITGD